MQVIKAMNYSAFVYLPIQGKKHFSKFKKSFNDFVLFFFQIGNRWNMYRNHFFFQFNKFIFQTAYTKILAMKSCLGNHQPQNKFVLTMYFDYNPHFCVSFLRQPFLFLVMVYVKYILTSSHLKVIMDTSPSSNIIFTIPPL